MYVYLQMIWGKKIYMCVYIDIPQNKKYFCSKQLIWEMQSIHNGKGGISKCELLWM